MAPSWCLACGIKRPLKLLVKCPNVRVYSRALAIFHDIVSCPLSCDGITNDQGVGVIPRSFYCDPSAKRIELLIVGKNPAHAPEWETQRYARITQGNRAEAHLKIVKELFTGAASVGTGFHSNLIRRVAGVLGVPATFEEVFRRAALTALVKCQSAGLKTASLPVSTVQTCAARHLLREIEHYRPAYLPALGGEVYRFLTGPMLAAKHQLPVGELYHPSWSNMRGGERLYFETAIPRLHAEFVASSRAPNNRLKRSQDA
jgi:DNA polymerase